MVFRFVGNLPFEVHGIVVEAAADLVIEFNAFGQVFDFNEINGAVVGFDGIVKMRVGGFSHKRATRAGIHCVSVARKGNERIAVFVGEERHIGIGYTRLPCGSCACDGVLLFNHGSPLIR